ncbi:hypothetical protein B0T22DRAFT_445698 [Podospora appendiculata]|uniref:Fe2OG dioxygenase domain-containing protein n=1 Tax=Podospora appendiculata TaxID=314037 RepID=A0AAE0WZ10_9PEZI|nr:hypothetical protein B0T22DRAFT_445698 [Podospora appendiculata]
MASADVIAPSTPTWTPFQPITTTPDNPPAKDAFDPAKHLNFSPPSKTYSMTDLGLPEGTGISPLAVSEPFPLFTQEAVLRMREEVLSKDVMRNCQYSSPLAQAQLRGYANKYAPFVYDAWKHPETQRIVSQVAGIDLTLQFDLEIGHVNLSFKTEEQKRAEGLSDAPPYRLGRTVTAASRNNNNTPGDDAAIVDWHTDSYPFVCVTMLSDCTNMIGGETALRTGSGDILKVRSPQMGHALVLQGRYISHSALRALNSSERITMVTSFRPRNPRTRDDTVLTTVRPISNLAELYYQFSKYRLEILEERIRAQLRELTDAGAAGRTVSTRALKRFFTEQREFLAHMDREMVDEDDVVVGCVR